jgi:predicted component of type VI protein secretion system
MIKKYYNIPLRPDMIMKRQDHPSCELHESIAHHIHLMISSRYGEYKIDESFGNILWDNEFCNITKNNNIKEQIKTSLYTSIVKYESRIENVRVEIQVAREETTAMGMRALREKVIVEVTATVKKNKDVFKHYERFFIAPSSYF